MTLRTKTSQHASGDTFTAIAHPIRRQILDMLIGGERSVRSIAEPFTASRPAISQHLRVLLDAELVAEQRDGRERRYRLHPERLREPRAGYSSISSSGTKSWMPWELTLTHWKISSPTARNDTCSKWASGQFYAWPWLARQSAAPVGSPP